jgi:lipoprotein-releasing system ATP-binding protein
MTTDNNSPLVSVRSLGKSFTAPAGELVVLNGLDLAILQGETLAIVGASGSGKSTLLHILGSLDSATSGEVEVAGIKVHDLSKDSAAHYRSHTVGFLWQLHWLLPDFTALENVAMPLRLRGESEEKSNQEAFQWLERVGLKDRANHTTGELSGGEQQRVALARALVTGPKLLLADEPTGDLDPITSAAVFDLLMQIQGERGLTSIIVTHDSDIARRCGRILRLQGGLLVAEQANTVQK